MPATVRTPFVATHDSDALESDLLIATDRREVVGCGINRDSVETLIRKEVATQCLSGIATETAAVDRWIEVEVDACVVIVRIRFGCPLDRADHRAEGVLDREDVKVGVEERIANLRREVVASPASSHLGGRSDLDESIDIAFGSGAKSQRSPQQPVVISWTRHNAPGP